MIGIVLSRNPAYIAIRRKLHGARNYAIRSAIFPVPAACAVCHLSGGWFRDCNAGNGENEREEFFHGGFFEMRGEISLPYVFIITLLRDFVKAFFI